MLVVSMKCVAVTTGLILPDLTGYNLPWTEHVIFCYKVKIMRTSIRQGLPENKEMQGEIWIRHRRGEADDVTFLPQT